MPSFCRRGGRRTPAVRARLRLAMRTLNTAAYTSPRTRCRMRGAGRAGRRASREGPWWSWRPPGWLAVRWTPKTRPTWKRTLLRSTNAAAGKERMAAGVQDLPTDALPPATICSRAWSERSPRHALATRRRQACPSGTAMASMHALPLRPRLVCPDPGTGETPSLPNQANNLFPERNLLLGARLNDLNVEVASDHESRAWRRKRVPKDGGRHTDQQVRVPFSP